MKFLIALLVSLFVVTSTVHAGGVKEIYTTTQEEVDFYYQATGEWTLVRIYGIGFVPNESAEYTIVSAKTVIKNINTEKLANETCLVTFVTETRDFYSINCF